MEKQRDSLSEFWDGKMNIPQLKVKQDSVYDLISSEISAGIFSLIGTPVPSAVHLSCPTFL